MSADGPNEATSATAPAPLAFASPTHATVEHLPPHGAMSLDFDVPEVPDLQGKAAHKPAEPASFDLSNISLDLDMPAGSATPSAVSGFSDLDLPALGDDGDDDPLSRKLELAEEFRQIGDTDGARDLLHEVVAKSTGAVKSRAQSMLADLG